MSVLARLTAPGTTTERYEEVIRRLEGTGDFPPDGLEYHVCFLADGDVRVSEIWDSLEQFQAFGERLMPVLAEAGIDPGQPEMFEIHNIIRR